MFNMSLADVTLLSVVPKHTIHWGAFTVPTFTPNSGANWFWKVYSMYWSPPGVVITYNQPVYFEMFVKEQQEMGRGHVLLF